MLTHCPVCLSLYRLHSGVLDSNGAVFCAQCKCVFDATRTMGEAADENAPRSAHQKKVLGDRTLLITQGIALAEPYKDHIESTTLPTGVRPEMFSHEDGQNTKSGMGFGDLIGVIKLSLNNLLRNSRRSIFACGAIGFGVVAILLAGGFIEWILDAMRESTIRSQLGHIQVTKTGYRQEGQVDPFSYLLPKTAPELEQAEELAHVEVVAPRLYFSGLLSYGETTVSFIAQGIDPAKEGELSEEVLINFGENLKADDEAGVILGIGLARNVGASVGDMVILLANTKKTTINAVELTVVGIFNTPVKAFDDSALRIHINTAESLLKASGSHAWLVLLDETIETDNVVEQLRAALPAESFEVVPWRDLADFFNKTVRLFGRQVNLVAMIIGLLILLSISNTMMMNVMERTSEIGTLMAIGLRRSKVRALFLCEGILLGVIGGLLGVTIGWTLGYVISVVGIPMPPPPGAAVGFTAEIMVTPKLMLMGFLVAVTATTVATLYPAYKASRLNVVDALRHGK